MCLVEVFSGKFLGGSEDSVLESLEFGRDGLAWWDGGDEGVVEERSNLRPKNDYTKFYRIVAGGFPDESGSGHDLFTDLL